jgi:glutamine cyclotransferase
MGSHVYSFGWLQAGVRRLLARAQPDLAGRVFAAAGFAVIRVRPHDPTAFTQGLVWADGMLFESTGLHGRSTLRRVDLETGRVQRMVRLPDGHFAEGIARVGDRIVQLTWRSGVGFVYDRESLEPVGQFAYAGEGWGLAFDGRRLILSDGTPFLRFLEPATFAETGRLEVHADGRRVVGLNDLEVVGGEIVANVYPHDRLARIAADGEVIGWVDLGPLRALPGNRGRDQLANGVACDPVRGRLFVTGKHWPRLFEIALS